MIVPASKRRRSPSGGGMIHDLVRSIGSSTALWGFLGAFIYGAFRFSACIYERDDAHPRSRCALEFGFVLATGIIGAAALSGLVGDMLKQHDTKAIAAVIGLLANPAAPLVIAILEGRITKILGGDK